MKVPFDEWDRPMDGWLLSGRCRDGHDRTLLLEVATRTLFPTMLVFSLYLLLVGHYSPGGGFSGGLVAGLAFVLRYIAGGDVGLGAVVSVRTPVLIGSGLTISVLTALVPLVVGAPVLSSAKLEVVLPLIGPVSTQTSLFLDVGVYVLIVGVVLDLLRSLGAGIDRDMQDAGSALMITINLVMALTVGALFATGFYLLLQRSLMRVLLGVVVLGHGTNLLLQIAAGPPGAPPVLGTGNAAAITDPLPQALALTAVVITFALTTFLLALGYRSFVLVGHDEVQDDVEDRRIATQTMPSASLDEDHDHSERAAVDTDDEDSDDVEAAAR